MFPISVACWLGKAGTLSSFLFARGQHHLPVSPSFVHSCSCTHHSPHRTSAIVLCRISLPTPTWIALYSTPLSALALRDIPRAFTLLSRQATTLKTWNHTSPRGRFYQTHPAFHATAAAAARHRPTTAFLLRPTTATPKVRCLPSLATFPAADSHTTVMPLPAMALLPAVPPRPAMALLGTRTQWTGGPL